MESGNNYNNSSYGTSWADQWDPLPEYSEKSSSSKKNTTSAMASKGLEKTKTAASTGAKKVKGGLTWIKDKYHKTTHKST